MAAKQTLKPGKVEEGNWNHILQDPLAELRTFSQNIALADIDGSGESKIILGVHPLQDTSPEIKILTGGTVVKAVPFSAPIAGLAVIYQAPDANLPVLAVSAGDSVFAFKNLNPFHKFTLPPLPVPATEQDVWVAVRNDENIDHDALSHTLQDLALGQTLSSRSIHYLGLSPTDRPAFVEQVKDLPITRQPVITTMATIHKNVVEERAPACCVVGTEDGSVVVLNPSNFAVLLSVKVPGSVCHLSCAGSFDVDHRILVSTRDNKIYTIKGGRLADNVITLPSMILGCGRVLKSVLVVCKNQFVYAYNTKGKRLWQAKLPADPLAVAPFTYKPKLLRGLMVGLSNGDVRLYNDTTLLDVIPSDFPVVAMAFGHVFRGTYALAIVGTAGELTLKRVRKGAEFAPHAVKQGPPPEQNIRINVPSKTQLYLDQTQRERDNAVAMHRAFQRDLYMLQLNIARSYVQAINKSLAPDAQCQDVQLQVGAQVQGIGPRFKLSITIQNISRKLAKHLRITIHCDNSMYDVDDPVLTLSAAAPGIVYRKTTFVQYLLEDELVASPITAHVFLPPAVRPVVTAVIDMPIAEPLLSVR
eukprot:m.92740 g.92740  ORF g.92740 m.92740 type:complete len:586 (-) comp14960_c1_seq1:48-1805(-)